MPKGKESATKTNQGYITRVHNKKEDDMEYFLKWICGWANLADGLCLIVTLGFYSPNISYYAECMYLDYMTDRIKKS
jgi:hypothetical protein